MSASACAGDDGAARGRISTAQWAALQRALAHPRLRTLCVCSQHAVALRAPDAQAALDAAVAAAPVGARAGAPGGASATGGGAQYADPAAPHFGGGNMETMHVDDAVRLVAMLWTWRCGQRGRCARTATDAWARGCAGGGGGGRLMAGCPLYRHGGDVVLAFGCDGRAAAADVHTFSCRDGHWRSVLDAHAVPPVMPRCRHAAVVVGDTLIAHGGCAGPETETLSDAIAVNLVTGAAEVLACGPRGGPGPRQGHVLCCVRGEVVLVGGAAGEGEFGAATCDGACVWALSVRTEGTSLRSRECAVHLLVGAASGWDPRGTAVSHARRLRSPARLRRGRGESASPSPRAGGPDAATTDSSLSAATPQSVRTEAAPSTSPPARPDSVASVTGGGLTEASSDSLLRAAQRRRAALGAATEPRLGRVRRRDASSPERGGSPLSRVITNIPGVLASAASTASAAAAADTEASTASLAGAGVVLPLVARNESAAALAAGYSIVAEVAARGSILRGMQDALLRRESERGGCQPPSSAAALLAAASSPIAGLRTLGVGAAAAAPGARAPEAAAAERRVAELHEALGALRAAAAAAARDEASTRAELAELLEALVAARSAAARAAARAGWVGGAAEARVAEARARLSALLASAIEWRECGGRVAASVGRLREQLATRQVRISPARGGSVCLD